MISELLSPIYFPLWVIGGTFVGFAFFSILGFLSGKSIRDEL